MISLFLDNIRSYLSSADECLKRPCLCFITSIISFEMIHYNYIWERIWEKGPFGNIFANLIAVKLPFQMLQTILKYSS